MTVVLNKKSTREQIDAAKKKLIRKDGKSKRGLLKYFGALKRGLDGLEYQKEVRNEWH